MRRYCRRCRQPLTEQQSRDHPSFCSDTCHDLYRQRRRVQREGVRHGGDARNTNERRALARLARSRLSPADYVARS